MGTFQLIGGNKGMTTIEELEKRIELLERELPSIMMATQQLLDQSKTINDGIKENNRILSKALLGEGKGSEIYLDF